MESRLSYFTNLQGSQTTELQEGGSNELSYFTNLQGSQTIREKIFLK